MRLINECPLYAKESIKILNEFIDFKLKLIPLHYLDFNSISLLNRTLCHGRSILEFTTLRSTLPKHCMVLANYVTKNVHQTKQSKMSSLLRNINC